MHTVKPVSRPVAPRIWRAQLRSPALRRSPGLRTMGAEDWGIGHEVSGMTSTGEASGEVYTFDEGTGIAVLRTKGDIVNCTTSACSRRVRGRQVRRPQGEAHAREAPVVDEARNQREAAAIKAARRCVSSPPRDRTSPCPRASRNDKHARARAKKPYVPSNVFAVLVLALPSRFHR